MAPKRTSTSAAPAMTQAAIRKLVADSVATALEAQAATMENTDIINRNIEERESPVQKALLASSAGLSELNQCFPVATIPKTTSIEGNVTASKPQTLEEAINIAQRLMDQVTKHTQVQVSSDHKRKFDDRTNNCYNNHQLQLYKRQEAVRACIATPAENSRYARNLPLCRRCVLHYTGPCTVKCNTCNKVGHLTKKCKNKGPATGSNLLPVTVTCHACREKGHYANQYRKTTNNNAQGRAYMLRDRNAHQDPNVVT
ncbi:reverse transcriptase domain-containing protein, partial [Tanacetum coccineum]